MKYILLCLIAVSLSCSSSKESVSETTEEVVDLVTTELPANNKAVYEVLKFNTTHCFGRCPVYTLKYYSNGQMVYEGKDNVDYRGRYVKDLDKVAVADLNKLIEYAELDDAEKDYDPNIVDASVINLYYTVPGEPTYHVKGVFSFPENIKKLVTYLKKEYKSPDESWTQANLLKPAKKKRYEEN